MLTFVIPLTPKVADLGLAAPFLYPLQAAGQVRLIPADLPLDHMDEYVRLEVQYGHESHWQLFFLLHQDDQITDPLAGSLTATLWRLRQQVLEPLAEQGLRPRQVWLAVLDEVPRLAEAAPEPRQPLAWQRWHLDATGFVTIADFPYLFTSADLTAVREAWGAPFDLANYQTDKGLAGLPEDKQQDIKQRLAALRQTTHEIIAKKLNHLPPAAEQSDTPFTDKGILEAIQADYEQFLSNLEQSPDIRWLGQQNPTEEFPRCVARHFSLTAVNQDVVILCCREAGAPFQRLLLRLVYGLLVAALRPEAFFDQDGKILNLEVSWDQEAWRQMLATHLAVLQRGQAQVQAKATAPVPAPAEEPDETGCVCRQVLPPAEVPKLAFPWLRRVGDVAGWQQWLEKVGSLLADRAAAADRLLQKCHRELQPPEVSGAESTLAQLQHLIAVKQAELQTARLALLRPKGLASRPVDVGVGEAEPGALVEAINQRPSGRLLTKSLLAAALLAGLPQTLYTLRSGGRDAYLYLGEFFLLFLVLAGLGAAAAIWRFHRRLATLVDRLHQAAEAKLTSIADQFNRAKEYLQDFCRCQALQHLLRQAQAQAAELDRRRQSRYHARRLEQQRHNLTTLAQLLGITLPSPPAQLNPAGGVAIDVTLPAEGNVIYHPTWTPEGSGHVEIPLVIGSQQTMVQRPELRGVQKLNFADGTKAFLEPPSRL